MLMVYEFATMTEKRMGFDLHGINGGLWSYNNSAWFFCLKVAEANGWEPLGTRMTEHSPEWAQFSEWLAQRGERIEDYAANWTGGYGSNDWQTVSEEDAQALAAALDRAVGGGSHTADERQVLTELADLARRGPFLIG